MKILNERGWKVVDRCGCGGRSQRTYRHEQQPGYEIKVYVDEAKWTLYLNNRKLTAGNEPELLVKIEEFGLVTD